METLIDDEPGEPLDAYAAYRVEYRRLVNEIASVLRAAGRFPR